LPEWLLNSTEESLRKIISKVMLDLSSTSYNKTAKAGKKLIKPSRLTAKNIVLGFKAPIAMALSPVLANIIPHFKFIHVIR